MQNVSENLRALRVDLGLSQAALGKILGVTRGAVSQWEKGKTLPAMEHLIMLARHFKVPLEQITGQESEATSIDRALKGLDDNIARAMRASFLVQIAAVKKPSDH